MIITEKHSKEKTIKENNPNLYKKIKETGLEPKSINFILENPPLLEAFKKISQTNHFEDGIALSKLSDTIAENLPEITNQLKDKFPDLELAYLETKKLKKIFKLSAVLHDIGKAVDEDINRIYSIENIKPQKTKTGLQWPSIREVLLSNGENWRNAQKIEQKITHSYFEKYFPPKQTSWTIKDLYNLHSKTGLKIIFESLGIKLPETEGRIDWSKTKKQLSENKEKIKTTLQEADMDFEDLEILCTMIGDHHTLQTTPDRNYQNFQTGSSPYMVYSIMLEYLDKIDAMISRGGTFFTKANEILKGGAFKTSEDSTEIYKKVASDIYNLIQKNPKLTYAIQKILSSKGHARKRA